MPRIPKFPKVNVPKRPRIQPTTRFLYIQRELFRKFLALNSDTGYLQKNADTGYLVFIQEDS